jgi:hypothetical protein
LLGIHVDAFVVLKMNVLISGREESTLTLVNLTCPLSALCAGAPSSAITKASDADIIVGRCNYIVVIIGDAPSRKSSVIMLSAEFVFDY